VGNKLPTLLQTFASCYDPKRKFRLCTPTVTSSAYELPVKFPDS